MTSYTHVHRLVFDLRFPYGVAFGEGGAQNELPIARDGLGRPVLRGTALAGVLRAAWRRCLDVSDDDPKVVRFFGIAAGNNNDLAAVGADGRIAGCSDSPLEVPDTPLQLGDVSTVWRTHHLRCRHLGRVVDGGLFRVEATPPHTHASITLWLKGRGDEGETAFLASLVAILRRGIVCGGNGNRGIGMAQIEGEPRLRTYDLRDDQEAVAFESDHWKWRQETGQTLGQDDGPWTILAPAQLPDAFLKINLTLEIPPGQDLLIGDGQGLDCEIEPQRVRGADGRDYWRLPGGTLRGALADWIKRLARREGKHVADSYDQFCADTQEGRRRDGKWLGNLCIDSIEKPHKREDREALLEDLDETHPVEDLFGSLLRAGRIHITDGLAEVSKPHLSSLALAAEENSEVQRRMHVAVNPLTGGAVEHMLFDNLVLVGPVRFPVTILMERPREQDVHWLARALAALHAGTIRIGSSKSAGRLRLVDAPTAVGTWADVFLAHMSELTENKGEDLLKNLRSEFRTMSSGNDTAAEEKPPAQPDPAQPDPAQPDVVGRIEIDHAKSGKRIVRIVYQRPGKAKQTQIDYTSIREEARGFRPEDAENKDPVHLYLDKRNQPIKVVIPGKEVVPPRKSTRGFDSGTGPVAVKNLPKGPPKLLGMPFHNPYTFLPFGRHAPPRVEVTPRTIDESETNAGDFFTGTIQIKVRTRSPLLSSEGMHEAEKERLRRGEPVESREAEHKTYRALTIGEDVIVPATGVRGFLRYWMTLVTGAPPAFLEPHTYLCQGRDAPLGPSKEGNGPRHVFLAEVVQPGSYDKPGTIRLGKTRLIEAWKLTEAVSEHLNANLDKLRRKASTPRQRLWVAVDRKGHITEASWQKSATCQWAVKLSGRPVKAEGKKEGLFRPTGPEIELPAEYWAAYMSRHQHGVCPELKRGHLVWLEPDTPERDDITEAAHIKSLQWARWGRHGTALLDLVPKNRHPDYRQSDGKVSVVTNLFGQVPPELDYRSAPQFKGRIMPGNLVFADAKTRLQPPRQLAVLASPHPGCLPFYRENATPENVETSTYAGYKVYRTSKHASVGDKDAPWKYENQGVYDQQGRLEKRKQAVCFSAQLLPEGMEGTVELAVRSLSREELALLLLACQATWRLGGGKPLGLGHMEVLSVSLFDEEGKPVVWRWENLRGMLRPEVLQRARWWEASQQPVEQLRYPRAVVRNKNKNARGGFCWFQKCASPQKGISSGPRALEPIYVCGELRDRVREEGVDNSALGDAELIEGQVLRPVDPNDLEADLLYGYDAFFVDTVQDAEFPELTRQKVSFNENRQQCYPNVVPFELERHATGRESSGDNISQNRKTRQRRKERRGE